MRHCWGDGDRPPKKVARNSIGRSFNKLSKRCNCNDLNSMFEIVTGELRAKLSVGSAMRQARAGHDTRGQQVTPRCRRAGPGRASRRRTEPCISDQAPLVWRAPEGPAAVPVGGGRAWPGSTQTPRPIGGRREACGAWPGFETTRRAKLAARTASGWAGRAAAGPSGARNTSGATSIATDQAGISRIYSPARRSTSCMMRPHTALTHATAATPRTRERQGLTCRKSSKP